MVLLLFLISIYGFTQNNIELFGGIPINWENGKILGYDAKAQLTSISWGFGTAIPINKHISLCVSDEIIFPQKLEISTGGEKTSVGRDAYKSLMGMSVLIGTSFNLFNDDQGKFKIPLNVGFRWMWLMASTQYVSIFGSNFGLSAGIGTQFSIGERFYLTGRVMMYYDFYSFSTTKTAVKTTTISGAISSFGITPNIGIGITF